MPKKIDDLQKSINSIPGDDADQKTVFWAHAMLAKAKKGRLSIDARRRKAIDFYIGGDKQWDDGKMPGYRAKITDNRCFSVVESALPIITDSRPKAELAPRDQDDIDPVRMLKRVYDDKWDSLGLEMLTTLVVKDMLIFGDGFLKVWFDYTLSDGLGDIRVSHVNPDYVYIDPESKHPLLDDAKYVIYHARTPLSLIKMRYPDKAAKLDAQMIGTLGIVRHDMAGEPAQDNVSEHGTIAYESGDTAPTEYTTYRTDRGVDGQVDKVQPYLTEIWVDDLSIEKVDSTYILFHDDGSDVEFSQEALVNAETSGREFEIVSGDTIGKATFKRTYPYGRIITVCENVLLRDDPSPYEHGRCPYVRFFDYPIPHTNQALGEMEQIIPLQKELNKRKSQVIDYFNVCINPPIVIDRSAGLNTQKMTNRPGQIWPVNGNTDKVKWLVPPPIPAAAFQHIDQIQKDIDTVSGIHDVTQGRNPTGITAGIAIESLQEAAQTRLRLKSRFVEYSHKRMAELMISIIWQYYQEPRTIRWKSNVPKIDYEYERVNFKDVELKGGLPDVIVKPGSTLPVNKSVMRSQAVQLAQTPMADGSPILDRRGVLETFEWPNLEEILARMGDGGAAQGLMGMGGGQGAPSP